MFNFKYAIDTPLETLNPYLYKNLPTYLRFPQTLPYNVMDLSRTNTSANARSDLGPQVFVGEASTYTRAHIDGGGLVDSVHLTVLGYNEVVIIDPLEEEDDVRNAFRIINKGDRDGDYTEDPHDLGGTFVWPTHDTFEELCQAGYHPVRVVLKPGTMLHIMKGSMHIFRKMSNNLLDENDCFSEIRKNMLLELGNESNSLDSRVCLSIVWDACFLNELCGPTAVTETINYLQKTVKSDYFQGTCKKKGMLVFPKTSIFNLCNYLFEEVYVNETSKNKTNVDYTLKNLRAMIPIVSEMVSNEIEYFQNKNSIDLESTSDISDQNCDYETTNTCDECNGEIFNVYYLTNHKKNAKHVCPDCALMFKKSRSKRKFYLRFKFYDVDGLNRIVEYLADAQLRIDGRLIDEKDNKKVSSVVKTS